MLIDEYFPSYDVVERHRIEVNAPSNLVYDAARNLDLSDSRIVRALFRLREIPGWCRSRHSRAQRLGLTLEDLLASGFVVLGERSEEEIVLGLVGRFWTASGGIKRVDAKAFFAFSSPGYAKAAWNFSLRETPDAVTELTTETRVLCLDNLSRRRFRLYWTLVAPFSGLIRMEALRSIKRAAESKAAAGPSVD
ncbi:MAG: hypothetical protein AABO41_25335 [Acidobacteriota bacterium]